jgi:PRTRC genetic system ThiF family protein
MKKTAVVGNRKCHLAPQFGRIVVVGTGGTGSYLVQGLAKMIAGYRLQVKVTLVDPDVVEERNCARQNFSPWEVGQGKAEALAFRLNQQYGLDWGFVREEGEKRCNRHDPNRLIVTCVDTVAARKPFMGCGPWLDLGNGVETGQALYGTTENVKNLAAEVKGWDKTPHVGSLPSPFLAFGMVKLKSPRKKAPACADTPFAEQGVFANEWAAAAGLTILHQLLVKGELMTPAIYFDTAKGRMAPEFITREYLSR